MKLGFVSAILPDLSLREVFQTAAELQYDCVEMMCWPAGKAERRYAGVSHIDVAAVARGDMSELKELIDEFRVQVSALGYYPNPLMADRAQAAAAVDHLKLVIDAAQRSGIHCVTSFIGRDPALSVDENWPRFLEVWKPLVKQAEDGGVRIAIENCPMLFTNDEWPGGKNLAVSPLIWRRMFNDIPSDHFGLNYDPSHMIWQQMDYLRPLREFSDRLFHAHAKDVRMDRHRLDDVGILATPASYHTPKLPGMGDVDWGQFFSVLSDTGYRGPVCVEVEDRAYEDSLVSRRAALRQSATFLRNYLPQRPGQ